MFEWSVECCVYGSICVFLVITASLHSFDEANLSPYCEVSPNVEWHACEVHKFCWSELMVSCILHQVDFFGSIMFVMLKCK